MSFGVPAVLDNRHFLSVGMAAPYGLVYCAAVLFHVPVQQRDVISFRFSGSSILFLAAIDSFRLVSFETTFPL